MITLYFTDFVASEEQIIEEIDSINLKLRLNGLDLIVKDFTTIPPFKGFDEEKYYNIMFFDYGGAMDSSYSIVSNFIECILKESIECPDRFYIVTSTFSGLIHEFEDLVSNDFGNEKPFNVFYSIEEFINFYKLKS